MAKFRVLTLSLATLAVVAGQRQQFNFESGPPSGPPPSAQHHSGPPRPSSSGPPGGGGRGPPPGSFPYRLFSAMQSQGRGIKELFTSASSPQFRKELFGPPRGPTHYAAPPKAATFYLEPPTRGSPLSFYGGSRSPQASFGRSPAPLFKLSSQKNPISLTTSETNNQLPQEYVLASSGGSSRGRPSQQSVEDIVAQAAQAQHDKVIQKEQRAHPNGRITSSQIRVAGGGGPRGPPPQFQQGLGFNPYASQVIGGQQDNQQLIMTTGPDGNPVLLQVQSSGPVQYSGGQSRGQFLSQQSGGPPVQYLSQPQDNVQYVSQQPGPPQFSGAGQPQIQYSSGPPQQTFQFGGQQYASIGGQQPGNQIVQYIQSSEGQNQGPTILTSRPGPSSSSSQSPEEVSLTNFNTNAQPQFIQQSELGGQQFDMSQFLSQGGFNGQLFPLDGPSNVYQQGQDGQFGQQLFLQSSQGGQGFGSGQSSGQYILQSQGQDIPQLQQNQIEQPKQAQSQSQPQQQQQSSKQQFQIQPAISESIPEQRQNVKPSSLGSNEFSQ